MRNGWLAFSLLCAACVGAAVRPVVFPAANAAAPSERCDWRYLQDAGGPEVPEDREQGPMGEEWAAMGAAGYHVVNAEGAFYLFERCTPTQ